MPVTSILGTRLHYLDSGWRGSGSRSPAVALVHAFPLHAGMWGEQIDALSDRWRVVAPDLPGFGHTDPLPEGTPPTVDGYADLVAALIDHLELGPVVVGGLSMGGYVAFALQRRHPELVAGLVLADTRASADTPEILERRTSQQRQVAEAGTEELVEMQLANLLTDETRAQRPEVVERARALMAPNSAKGVIDALEAMKGRADSTAALAGIDLPTLVLVGEHDGPTPPDVAQEMADAIPAASIEVIPGAGHLSNLESPEAFNRALESFLARL